MLVVIIVNLDSSHLACKCDILETNGPQRNTTSMAALCSAQFIYVGLNVFLGVIFVLANQDVSGNVFETRIGK